MKKMSTNMAQFGNFPTQLDEIDQWLFDSFGIVAGACSSTENLRYNTAKMVAEALWPKCKDSLHIQETCKENGDSFTDETDSKKDSGDSKNSKDLEKAAEDACKHCKDYGRCFYVDKNRLDACDYLRGFKAGADWQREQDKETIELAEDHAMLAGMVKKEEEMREKALELTVYPDDDGYPCIPEIVLFDFDKNKPTAKEGDKVKVYIFRDNKE